MERDYKFYLGALLLITIVVLAYFILKPFIIAILTAMVITYIFYPLYSFINKIFKMKTISALVVTIIVFLIVTLPLFFLINAVLKETYVTYLISKQKILSGDIFRGECKLNNSICKIVNKAEELLKDPKRKYYLETATQKVTSFIADTSSNFLFSIPLLFLNLFVILFLMFYLFRDGKKLSREIKKLLPLRTKYKNLLLSKFNEVIYAVVYGHIIVAMIQGLLGGIGFYFFGIPSPVLWGIVMWFFALIPMVGTPVVWAPAAILLMIDGYLQGSNTLIIKGVLLILYGIFIISSIDNILKPKIIGARARVHPVLVLLGVLGGLKLFGFVGIIIGPVILALIITLIDIYEIEQELERIE